MAIGVFLVIIILLFQVYELLSDYLWISFFFLSLLPNFPLFFNMLSNQFLLIMM